ncbi:MAG: hypothetical protein AAF192_07080 [Pseudomonadota bacterium]
MPIRAALAACLAVFAAASAAQAMPTFYAYTAGNQRIVSYDPVADAFAQVTQPGEFVGAFRDIASSGTPGQLLGLDFFGRSLSGVSLADGRLDGFFLPFPDRIYDRLSWDPVTGTLFAQSVRDIYEIDLTTGAGTLRAAPDPFGGPGNSLVGFSDFDYDAANDRFLLITPTASLLAMDGQTAEVTSLGQGSAFSNYQHSTFSPLTGDQFVYSEGGFGGFGGLLDTDDFAAFNKGTSSQWSSVRGLQLVEPLAGGGPGDGSGGGPGDGPGGADVPLPAAGLLLGGGALLLAALRRRRRT